MAGSYKFGSKKEIIQSITIDSKGVVRLSGNKIDVAKKGEQGLKGDSGRKGDIPKHEWDGTKIRLQNPDKTWGIWVDLKSVAGDNGKDGKNGTDGRNGTAGRDGKDATGKPGRNGTNGKDGVGTPGKDGKNGIDGENGAPGVEPEKMQEVHTNLFNMKEAIESMAERVSNVKDGRDGRDGADGKDGRAGESKQGFPGIQGDKGEPGIPPHDWNITLDKVARMEAAFKKMGVEI